MNSNMVKLEKFGYLHLVYHFTIPLRREMDIKLDNLPQFINLCFILRNFCKMRKEGLRSSELDKSLRFEKEFQPPNENNYKVSNNESGGKVIIGN